MGLRSCLKLTQICNECNHLPATGVSRDWICKLLSSCALDCWLFFLPQLQCNMFSTSNTFHAVTCLTVTGTCDNPENPLRKEDLRTKDEKQRWGRGALTLFVVQEWWLTGGWRFSFLLTCAGLCQKAGLYASCSNKSWQQQLSVRNKDFPELPCLPLPSLCIRELDLAMAGRLDWWTASAFGKLPP